MNLSLKDVQRFRQYVGQPDADGCVNWMGSHSKSYGEFWLGGRMVKAHRVSFTIAKGPIPPGFDVDHLCYFKGCINPDHLEAVPHRTNVLRGRGPTALNARKTHCVRGHELVGKNLRKGGGGWRKCLPCHNLSNRHGRERRVGMIRE